MHCEAREKAQIFAVFPSDGVEGNNVLFKLAVKGAFQHHQVSNTGLSSSEQVCKFAGPEDISAPLGLILTRKTRMHAQPRPKEE
ncbi:hypothetical protein SUGI_0609230 [Cryptomeria japonica]|nr:hypothetical protein SUGI_0609230 [Cryptomeria japonica]